MKQRVAVANQPQFEYENTESRLTNPGWSNNPMKTLKVVGGFLLGWFLASASTVVLISQSEISRTTDIIRVIVSLCGGIIGGVITYKRVNLKKI